MKHPPVLFPCRIVAFRKKHSSRPCRTVPSLTAGRHGRENSLELRASSDMMDLMCYISCCRGPTLDDGGCLGGRCTLCLLSGRPLNSEPPPHASMHATARPRRTVVGYMYWALGCEGIIVSEYPSKVYVGMAFSSTCSVLGPQSCLEEMRPPPLFFLGIVQRPSESQPCLDAM